MDTVGTREGQRLGEQSITNSDQLRINGRISLDKDNRNLLYVDCKFTDPDDLAQPWHRTHTSAGIAWHPDGDHRRVRPADPAECIAFAFVV